MYYISEDLLENDININQMQKQQNFYYVSLDNFSHILMPLHKIKNRNEMNFKISEIKENYKIKIYSKSQSKHSKLKYFYGSFNNSDNKKENFLFSSENNDISFLTEKNPNFDKFPELPNNFSVNKVYLIDYDYYNLFKKREKLIYSLKKYYRNIHKEIIQKEKLFKNIKEDIKEKENILNNIQNKDIKPYKNIETLNIEDSLDII